MEPGAAVPVLGVAAVVSVADGAVSLVWTELVSHAVPAVDGSGLEAAVVSVVVPSAATMPNAPEATTEATISALSTTLALPMRRAARPLTPRPPELQFRTRPGATPDCS